MEIRKKLLPGQFTIPDCKYVIIDTDAGGDDSQAIILAISQAKRTGKIIIGITCVDGNASLDDVATNVLICVSICDSDIPVYKGSNYSLMGPTHKDYYFSHDGIGMKQKEYVAKLTHENRWRSNQLKKQSGVDFIIESANKYPGDLAIIAIGPLTNLALAYSIDNSIAEKVGMISLMGGSISAFGIRQFFAAQFNFYLDAEAAKIVTDVFPNIYINSFDLSFDLGTKRTLPLFLEQTRQKAKFIHDIHSVILQTHRPAICDPLACIAVFFPEDIASIYEAYGNVELSGVRTRGLLVFDWLRKQELPGQFKIRAVAEINLGKLIDRISNSYN